MVSGRSEPAPTTEPVDPPRFRSRLVLGVLAVAAISAIAVPLAEQLAIRQSQTAAQNGNLAGALKDSITAQSVDPDAATPHLQEALVLEASGRLAEAAIQARIATRDGPTDWSNWLTLARIEAREGELRTALATFQRARHLNPRSTLFTET
jgi:Flp pilus assembly protein TadD